jgi:hypothetical protein
LYPPSRPVDPDRSRAGTSFPRHVNQRIFAVKDFQMMLHSRVAAWLSVVVAVVLLAGWTGCEKKSGSEYNVAPVKGTVTYEGEAVTEGSVRLQPLQSSDTAGITGKPASGQVGDDGTFVLSTYGEQDGAVIGKHKVSYLPIFVGDESYDEQPEPSAYVGLVPKTKEVEIKEGQNELNIELVKAEAE